MIRITFPMWFRFEDKDMIAERNAFMESLPTGSFAQRSTSEVILYTFYKDEDANAFLLKFGKIAKLADKDIEYEWDDGYR